MGTSRSCPRCRAAYPGPLPAEGGHIDCDSCGHRWTPAPPSDEYLPAETGGIANAARPLTERRTPPRQQPGGDDGGLPFDQLEAEAGTGQRQPSDLAFQPVTDPRGGRTSCPVCGHAFAGKANSDEQRCPQCGTSFSRSSGRISPGAGGTDRLIGRTLRGCQIDRKLGEGGMGAVYHARQLSLDRSVAIKVLPPELARNRNFIQRFEREAKSLARINHANILQIYDFGEDQQLGIYFMVIEYVDGWDLGEVMRRQPTLSQVETLDILRQALLGLEQAAEKGVIHRDIKPDNLMVATSGLCKVSDFGLAKGNGSGSEVTSVGVRVGTPAFMSPEQCDGVEVDSRSDVYNLGCTAYLMLTGRLPFDGETPFAIMLKHKVDPVPSPAAARNGIDAGVDALIRRMLAKRPDERCHELRELIDESERLLVELTGTASVLRKTNGPIRALVQTTAGHGSSGRRARAVAVEVELPPEPPRPAQPRPSPPRQAAASAKQPAPPAAPAAAIPDWLRPVDGPAAPAPATDPPSPPPAVGSRTAQAPAIGSRTAQAPAVGSRTGPQPAIGSRTAPAAAISGRSSAVGSRSAPLNTPFPGGPAYQGVPTPYPGAPSPPPEHHRASSSSALHPGAFDRARERGLRAEIASITAGADRLAQAGSWDSAASEYRRAANLARDSGESRRLADLSWSAARRGRIRRRLRVITIVLVSVALLAVNVWIWPPVVHNLLAERERARLDATAEPLERTRLLKDFAAANQGGWRWYRTLFGHGYEVPAAATAAIEADRPLPVRPSAPTGGRPRREPGATPAAEASAPDRLAADPAVPLQRVAATARAAGPAAAAILADAEQRLAAAAQMRAQIDAARKDGRHAEALDLAARLAADHPRAGEILAGLPLPGRVAATDADTGAAVPGLRLVVDGASVGGDRFCRSPTAETRLEVAAPGYQPARIAVVPGPDRDERTVEVRLGPAPLWRTAAPDRRPAWIRLHLAGERAAIAATPDAIIAVDLASGAARALTLPGTAIAPWWTANDAGWAFSTGDGELRQIPPTLERTVPVRRLGGAPLAAIELDLVYRAGGRMAVFAEADASGAALVAREGMRETWRVPGLSARHEVVLRRADDKLVAIDDGQVLVVEEEGKVAARLALRAPRSGPVAELPGGRLLVATMTGTELVQYGAGGARIIANQWLNDAGAALPASIGGDVVLARADRSIEAAQWPADPVRPRWKVALPGRPAQVSVGQGLAAVADEAGGLTVLRLSDGQTVRRLAHGAPLAVPPLLLPGLLMVADQTGATAGYRLGQ